VVIARKGALNHHQLTVTSIQALSRINKKKIYLFGLFALVRIKKKSKQMTIKKKERYLCIQKEQIIEFQGI
jgi:hypothetical protein